MLLATLPPISLSLAAQRASPTDYMVRASAPLCDPSASAAAPRYRRVVYRCSEVGAAVCSSNGTVHKAAGPRRRTSEHSTARASGAAPPQATFSAELPRATCEDGQPAAKRHDTESRRGARNASVDTRGPICSRGYHPTHLFASRDVQPMLTTSHPHPTLEIHTHTPTDTQHPSPSDPPPRRRHAAPRRLFLDPISGRSTASKGECTSEMQRSQRAAGRRGIWVMPGDVLLASRRYPRRRRSQHTPPARPAVDIMATSRLRYRMCRVHREETARTHSPVYRMHDAQATTIAPTSTTITPTARLRAKHRGQRICGRASTPRDE